MVDALVLNKQEGDCIDLPPGFRFHPTDEEIITHYLTPKIINHGFTARAVGEVDLNKSEPWDLPSKAKMEGKELYFFCQRDRKYPTGMRTNRATEAGYWKATGKDKEIFRGKGVLVGMKKTLVFYKGRAPRGEKTNWVMHEFRLEGKYSLPNLPKSAKDEWVVSRIFHKNIGLKKSPSIPGFERINSFGDDVLDSTTLPPLMDPPHMESSSIMPSSSFMINNDQILHFKAVPPIFSTMMGMDQNQQVMNHQMLSSNNPPLYPQVFPQGPYHLLPGSANLGYLHHQDEALMPRGLAAANNDASAAKRKLHYCKMEQYSNQSMGCRSQDTGLSTDHYTEISSVVSTKH